MYTLLIFWFVHVLRISVKKWFCVYSFSSNTILVLIVNSPVDYYIAGMRTNLPTGWSYSVSDLRMANVPTAGLCITVEMGEYSWPITAIVRDGGFIHLTGLYEGMPPMVRTWSNRGGRFYPRPARMCDSVLCLIWNFRFLLFCQGKKINHFILSLFSGLLQPNSQRTRTRFNVDRFITGYLFQWLVGTTLGPYFVTGENWRISIQDLYRFVPNDLCLYAINPNKSTWWKLFFLM